MATRKKIGTASVPRQSASKRSASSVSSKSVKSPIKSSAKKSVKAQPAKKSASSLKSAGKVVTKTAKSMSSKSSPKTTVTKSAASKSAASKVLAKKTTTAKTKTSLSSKSVVVKKSTKTVAKDAPKKVVQKIVVPQQKIEKKNIKKDIAKNKNSTMMAQQKSTSKKSMTSNSVAKNISSAVSFENNSKGSTPPPTSSHAQTKHAQTKHAQTKDGKSLNISKSKDNKLSEKKTLYAVVSSDTKDLPSKHEEGFKSVITPSQNELPQEVVDPGFLSNDDVFDETDHAQWQQLREQAAIHERAMNLNKPESHPDFNGKECIECGEVIPPARLQLRKVRCVDCQNDLEEQSKRQSRHMPARARSDSSGWDDA